MSSCFLFCRFISSFFSRSSRLGHRKLIFVVASAVRCRDLSCVYCKEAIRSQFDWDWIYILLNRDCCYITLAISCGRAMLLVQNLITFTGTCSRTTYLAGTSWMNKVDGVCQPVEQPLDNVCHDIDLRPSNETLVSNIFKFKHHLGAFCKPFPSPIVLFNNDIHLRNKLTHHSFLAQSISNTLLCQQICHLPHSSCMDCSLPSYLKTTRALVA